MMEETKSTLTKEKGIDQTVYEKIHEIKTSDQSSLLRQNEGYWQNVCSR